MQRYFWFCFIVLVAVNDVFIVIFCRSSRNVFNLLCVRVLVRLNTRMWYMYNCIAGGCTATSYSNTTHVLALFRLCSCRQKKNGFLYSGWWNVLHISFAQFMNPKSSHTCALTTSPTGYPASNLLILSKNDFQILAFGKMCQELNSHNKPNWLEIEQLVKSN